MINSTPPLSVTLAGVTYINRDAVGWVEKKTGKPVSFKLGELLDNAVEQDRKQHPEDQYHKFHVQDEAPKQPKDEKPKPTPRYHVDPPGKIREETPDPIHIGSKTFYYRNGSGWYDKATKKKVTDPISDFIDSEVEKRSRGDLEDTEEKGPGFLTRFARGTGNVAKQTVKNFAGNTALNFVDRLYQELPVARHFINPALGLGRSWGGGNYNGIGSIFSSNGRRTQNYDGNIGNVLNKILTVLVSINKTLANGNLPQKFGSLSSNSTGSSLSNNPLSGATGRLGGMFGNSALGRLAGGALAGIGNFAGKVFGNAKSGATEQRVGSIFDAPTINSVVVDFDNNALKKLASVLGGNTGSGIGAVAAGGGILSILKSFLGGALEATGIAGLFRILKGKAGDLVGGAKNLASSAGSNIGSFFKGSGEELAEGFTRDAGGYLRNTKGQFASARDAVVADAKPGLLTRLKNVFSDSSETLAKVAPEGEEAVKASGEAVGGGSGGALASLGGIAKSLAGPLIIAGFALHDILKTRTEIREKKITPQQGHKKTIGILGRAAGAIGGSYAGQLIGEAGGIPGEIAGSIVGGIGGEKIGGAITDNLFDRIHSNPTVSRIPPKVILQSKPSPTPMLLNAHSKMNSAMRDNLTFHHPSNSQNIVNAPSTTINNLKTDNYSTSTSSNGRGSLNLGTVL